MRRDPVRVGLVSLGCAKNLVDSEAMLGRLVSAGYEITADPAAAHVLLVNTCGFITDAKKESIDAILEMAAHKRYGRCTALVVAGCLAERYRDDLFREIPEIDAIVGVREVERIAEAVAVALSGRRVDRLPDPAGASTAYAQPQGIPRVALTPPHTAYLRIADGCSNHCSYCAIPLIRGELRSRPREALVSEARALAASGVKELVIVAQDCTSYGTDLYGGACLSDLLRDLARVDGVEWVRLMYCYPSRVTEDLVEVMASEPRICRYIDIPAQHASARLLRAMNRSHDGGSVLRTVERLRKAMPDIAIRTTFMVGFPGETESDFEELLGLIRAARFDRAGVFEYSREEGTPAAAMTGRVDRATRRERRRLAMSLQAAVSRQINRGLVGRTLRVLLERTSGPDDAGRVAWVGRSWRDAPDVDGVVRIEGSRPGWTPGCFVDVRVTRALTHDVCAEPR